MTGKYWTEQINPVSGCTLISEACANCYARAGYNIHHAAKREKPWYYSEPFDKVVLQPEQLVKFDQLARKKEPQVVFVGNMTDLFHEAVPFEYIAGVFGHMHRSKHTFILLTKRAERMKAFIEWFRKEWLGPFWSAWPLEYPTVWLGVTAENQARADERIPLLLETQASHRWVSVEPMLGAIDLTRRVKPTEDDYSEVHATLACQGDCEPEELVPCNELTGDYVNDGPELVSNPENKEYWDWVDYRARSVALKRKLDLVIAGYESGPRARRVDAANAYNLKRFCEAVGIKFYWKQWGDGELINKDKLKLWYDDDGPYTGQVLDGIDYSHLKPADIWKVTV